MNNDKKNTKPLIIQGMHSDVEKIKRNSNFLRGSIKEDLSKDITGSFTKHNAILIRFHGMYQQDDRDIRLERRKQKLEPRYAMMLRCRLPGGVITTEQWRVIDKFTTDHTIYGNIRLTNRQTFQLHGILKKNVKYSHQMLHMVGLDAFATANDVNRNVLCTSNPLQPELHKTIFQWAKKLSEHLLPKTKAYAEIWWDEHKSKEIDQEPILGNTYLPRKFKATIVIPPYNDVDLHSNDLNFIVIIKHNKIIGFNLLIGGGLSMEHGNQSTYPCTAKEVGFLPVNKMLDVATAVVTIQRDWGNRIDRKNAKTKYTLDRIGLSVFKAEIEKRAGLKFSEIYPYRFTMRNDRIGWVKSITNHWNLTLFIENGRIKDSADVSLKKGICEIAKIYDGEFRITPNHNLIIANVPENQKLKIDALARSYGLIKCVTPQRQHSMACVALPTCPLAMAEAERFLPNFLTKIEDVMCKNGLEKEYIVLRIAGCPNGCARAMLAEIGLIGKSLGRYNIYIGGNRIGTRIPRMYAQNLSEEKILMILKKLIMRWANERHDNEAFGDFIIRVGIIREVINPQKDFWN